MPTSHRVFISEPEFLYRRKSRDKAETRESALTAQTMRVGFRWSPPGHHPASAMPRSACRPKGVRGRVICAPLCRHSCRLPSSLFLVLSRIADKPFCLLNILAGDAPRFDQMLHERLHFIAKCLEKIVIHAVPNEAA